MTMNRFIAEQIMHVCCHEWKRMTASKYEIEDGPNFWFVCQVCKQYSEKKQRDTDYSTGKDKADLMDKCVGEEWWMPFVYWAQDRAEKIELAEIYAYLWRNLPQLVAEYHGYKFP